MSTEIWVIHDGQQMGPFARDLLISKVNVGELVRQDLSWQEGLAEWHPLEKLLGLPPLQLPPPLPPVSALPPPFISRTTPKKARGIDSFIYCSVGIITLVILGSIFVAASAPSTRSESPNDAASPPDAFDHYEFGRSTVEKMLISPSSASWTSPAWSPDKSGAAAISKRYWHAFGEVDAVNAFNVKIHETWETYTLEAAGKQVVVYARIGTLEVGSRAAAEAGVVEESKKP